MGPEEAVKAKVRRLLKEYGSSLHSDWPVPSGFGRTTIDCIGCYRGRYFGIETKAPGKKPTLRQTTILQNIGRAGGMTFVITGVDDPVFQALRQWLDELKETVHDDPYIPPDKVSRRPV